MHFTLTDYRDIFHPKGSIHLFKDLEILIELFEEILILSDDGFYIPRTFDIHLEPFEEGNEMTVIEFNAQRSLLKKFVKYDLIYSSQHDMGRYAINPKIVKYLEGRNQLQGKNINPN